MTMSDNDLKMKEELANILLPRFIQHLLINGLLEKDKSHDANYVDNIIRENINLIEEIRMVVEIHHEFIDAAKEAFAARRFEVVIILLTTAIEQSVNTFYRELLHENGLFTDKEITEIIRSNNISPKLGWLLTLVSEYQLNDELQKRVLNLMELRNQIIHYKASPDNLDNEKVGSHNEIQQRIKSLDFDDLFAIQNELYIALGDALENVREKLPEYKQSKEIFKLLKST